MRRLLSIFLFLSAITSTYAAQPTLRPYAEYEQARTLLMSAHASFLTGEAKRIVLENLPPGVSVILFDKAPAKKLPRAAAGAGARFKLWTGKGWTFWSRDALPYPVWRNGKLALVDARYHWKYEPDAQVAAEFHAPLAHHPYYFEGGNLLADRAGRCFIVQGKSDEIPDSIFTRLYGCSELIRLPYKRGIGHVDERIKIVSDKEALTDEPTYATELERRGFRVTLLPRGLLPFESYANALLVNGTVFVPQFSDPKRDRQALDAYARLGLRAIPFPSFTVSNLGQGSIHCMTMTYPSHPSTE